MTPIAPSGSHLLGALGLDGVTGAVEAIIVVFLLLLLTQREIMRAHAGTRRTPQIDAVTVAIVPLLLAAAVLIVLRMTGVR